MSEQARNYRIINPANLEDLTNQVNRVLAMIADRHDETQGYRGTPTFRATVDMLDNKISNAQEATADKDAVVKGQMGGLFSSSLLGILNKGFEWVGSQVNVKPKAGGAIVVEAAGLSVDWSLDPYKNNAIISRTTAQFDKNNAVFASIPGLTAALDAAGVYHFYVGLFGAPDGVGGHKYVMAAEDGLTATSIRYQIDSLDNAANAFVINSQQTALGGLGAGEASATSVFTEIKGIIVVDVAGTLRPQFAQNGAAGTSSILTHSWMLIQEIV